MQAIEFNNATYIIEPGSGLPDGAIDISGLTSKDQVSLYNLVSANLDGARVQKFKDKATGTRRITKALVSWNEQPDEGDTYPTPTDPPTVPDLVSMPEDDEPAKPKAERKKRGMRFVFPFHGADSLRSIRDGATLRGSTVVLLKAGAKFDAIKDLVVEFDKERGKESHNVERRAYELVRIMHYYVGYGVDHDTTTGLIKLHTREVGQS